MRPITLIQILLLSAACSAQPGFSVVHVGAANASGEGRSIFETSYGYLVFSAEVDQSSGLIWLYTTRFDPAGNHLGGYTFRSPRNLSTGLADCVSRSVTGNFHATVGSFSSDMQDTLCIYQFDDQGDTIATAFVQAEASQGCRDCLSINATENWACGWCTTNTDPLIDVACIRKIDIQGNEIIRRTWPNIQRFSTITQVEDESFLVGGIRSSITDKTVLMKVSAEGEEIWTRYLGGINLLGGGSGHSTLMANGNYLIAGCYLPPDSTEAGERSFASLYCYSPDGEQLWRRDLLYGRYGGAVLSRAATNDEYWVVGGYYQVPRDPDLAATIWRVDMNGDTLYSRKYWYYGGEGAVNAATYGIDTTSDGGLVLTGVASEGMNGQEPFNHKTWILKLDQHGCLVPGCHTVGLQVYELALQGALQVSPNPTHDIVRFTLELPNGYPLQGHVQALVLDAQGKEVARQNISASGTLVSGAIPLNGQAAGLYYLHFRDEEKWLAGQKVVVQ
ncbi:MAG: hypothetical protein JNM62_04745 [Flavobacteriales bacterium]|nr:hypothetical protein [Flavobacteriales bacterium]